MKKETTALIIVDIQEGFKDFFYEGEFDKMVNKNKMLIQYAKENGILTYNFKSPEFGETVEEIRRAMRGHSSGKTLSKKIEPDSCFTRRGFNEELIEKGIEDIIIAGLSAPYCIKGTGISAKNNGYIIHSAEGLVVAQRGEEKNMSDFESWFYREGNFYDSVNELIENIEL